MSRTAIVRGSVIDPSGAVIPGVVVRARRITDNMVASACTREDGEYTLMIPHETYEIYAEVSGFPSAILHVNRERQVHDIRLTVPTIEQTTKVSALDRQKRYGRT